MSLPYFLLTAQPAWMRFLPKPGLWMERLKQIMGFAMLAVAVWLFGILGLRGPQVVAGMSWFLLSLALAAWIFGFMRGPLIARLGVLLLPIAGYWLFLSGEVAAPGSPHPPLKLRRTESNGSPIPKSGSQRRWPRASRCLWISPRPGA